MGRSTNYDKLEDTAARKRKWRSENPEKELEGRKRAAVSLLERTGCLIGGVLVHDPRK